MDIGVLGSGMVGRTMAAALASHGADVVLGTRDVAALMAREADGESFAEWAQRHPGVRVAPFAEAAAHGALVFNATAGAAALDVLRSVAAGLAGTVLIDASNPLDFSNGFPPSLFVCNTDSLGEQIQAALPDTRVVKALNTVNADVMVDPSQVAGGDHDLFICGDDDEAKAAVIGLLQEWFGWTTVRDLGDITGARAMEMYLPLWLRLMSSVGSAKFSVRVVE